MAFLERLPFNLGNTFLESVSGCNGWRAGVSSMPCATTCRPTLASTGRTDGGPLAASGHAVFPVSLPTFKRRPGKAEPCGITKMISSLPHEVLRHLPSGYQSEQGAWLVLPEPGDADRGIAAVNSWIRAGDWYPPALNSVVWFGDDGVGNFIGWIPDKKKAILWNPEDGPSPWREDTVHDIWAFIATGYQ